MKINLKAGDKIKAIVNKPWGADVSEGEICTVKTILENDFYFGSSRNTGWIGGLGNFAENFKLVTETENKLVNQVNPELLEKRIEDIPGICTESKDAIKKLFEDGFGVKFPVKPVGPKKGEVWFIGTGTIALIVDPEEGAFVAIDKKPMGCPIASYYDKNYAGCNLNEKLADSPEEYFKKKAEEEVPF